MEFVVEGTRPRERLNIRWADRINENSKDITAQLVDAVRWTNKIRTVGPKSM